MTCDIISHTDPQPISMKSESDELQQMKRQLQNIQRFILCNALVRDRNGRVSLNEKLLKPELIRSLSIFQNMIYSEAESANDRESDSELLIDIIQVLQIEEILSALRATFIISQTLVVSLSSSARWGKQIQSNQELVLREQWLLN